MATGWPRWIKRRFQRQEVDPTPIGVRIANVLGIINSCISGKHRTRSQTCRQWKPPMLILDLVSTIEWDTLPIHSSDLGSRMGFECRLRLRGKLAVVPDTSGSHRVLVWTLVC